MRSAYSFSTAYSSAGFFESIVYQLCCHFGIGAPACSHGWEVDKKARQALMARDVPDGPRCIFGDLMGIWPTRVINKLFRVQKVLLAEHKRMVRAGHWSHVSGVLTKGLQLMQACDGLLSSVEPSPTAYCFRHGRHCQIPRVAPGTLVFHAAGTTCVDYSQRSMTQLRLLGRHSVVFACWAWSRRFHNEPFLLHECVVDHPSAWLLQYYLGKTHLVVSYILCPSIFGHACTRRRRFTLALHRSWLQTGLCPSPTDRKQVFIKYCFSKCNFPTP